MPQTMKSKIDRLKLDFPFIIRDIVDRQYALQPEFHKYGPRGMHHSLDDAKSNLEYLFSAIEADSVLLFIQYNRWANKLFINLKLPPSTLENFYHCTLEVFKEKLGSGLMDEELYLNITEYIKAGIDALKNDDYASASYFQNNAPYKDILDKYKQHVFSGDRAAVTKLIQDVANSDIEIKDIYKYILQPFQLELGVLWHSNQISVAQEHYATAVSQYAMSLLYEKIFSTPKNDKVFLGTCVQGELHEFGMRMVCDYMESCGWNTYYLGANMPDSSIIQAIKERRPDIVGVSCTMTFNVSRAHNLVQAIKSSYKIPVIVGGYPFNLDKELWNKIGADAYAGDFEDAYLISEKLYSGGKNEII